MLSVLYKVTRCRATWTNAPFVGFNDNFLDRYGSYYATTSQCPCFRNNE